MMLFFSSFLFSSIFISFVLLLNLQIWFCSQKGYFKGIPFHHVIKHYVIQAGHSQGLGAAEDWTTKGKLHSRLATRFFALKFYD